MLYTIAILPGNVVSEAQRPLFFLLVGFILTFGLTRLSTRLARAGVFARFRPGSIVTAGGLHIHHAVFGVIAMFCAGILAFAFSPPSPWIEGLALAFGAGAALTLDEFALILHLEDVYWTREGRASIDAVILGVTFMTLLLTGLLPRSVHEVGDYVTLSRWVGISLIVCNTAFVIVSYVKGKLFMGTIGIFIPPVAIVGSLRLAKPNSPWARRRYRSRPHKLERAQRRDEGFHRRWQHRKHFIWDLIGGAPHLHLPQIRMPHLHGSEVPEARPPASTPSQEQSIIVPPRPDGPASPVAPV
jgi:lysyl-tRNA synthetase class 2